MSSTDLRRWWYFASLGMWLAVAMSPFPPALAEGAELPRHAYALFNRDVPKAVPVPIGGVAIRNFVNQHGQVDILMTALSYAAAGKGGSYKAPDKIVSITQLRPDVLVIERGLVITLIPKVLLSDPRVGLAPILAGDLVSTFDSEAADMDPRSISLKNALMMKSDSPDPDAKFRVPLSGRYHDPNRVCEVNGETPIDRIPFQMGIDQTAYPRTESEFVVIILNRTLPNKKLLRLATPIREIGIYRQPPEDQEAQAKQWENYFGNFLNVLLQPGDRIEITRWEETGLLPGFALNLPLPPEGERVSRPRKAPTTPRCRGLPLQLSR